MCLAAFFGLLAATFPAHDLRQSLTRCFACDHRIANCVLSGFQVAYCGDLSWGHGAE
jgi:hypothetical protein